MHADHTQSSWRRIIINDILFANLPKTRFDAIAAKTGQMTLTRRRSSGCEVRINAIARSMGLRLEVANSQMTTIEIRKL